MKRYRLNRDCPDRFFYYALELIGLELAALLAVCLLAWLVRR